jgi:uncharacterized membrane protein
MNKNLLGLIVSIVTAFVAPIFGAAAITLVLGGSVYSTQGTDPSDKARVMGEGIAGSMIAVGGSMVIVALAIIAAVVFAVRLYKDTQRGRTAA